MKELRQDNRIPSRTAMEEALMRAAERHDSSDLFQGVRERAQGLNTGQVAVMPDVAFDPSHLQAHQDQDDEDPSGEIFDDLIDAIVLPATARNRGAARPQAEQELPQEATITRREGVAKRTQTNALLREVSTTATEQRATEIEQQRQERAEQYRQAEQARQVEAQQQERIAARERKKEEGQALAQQQRTQGEERRAKEAAELESKRAAKKAAKAAQPRRADIERQIRETAQPSLTPEPELSVLTEQQQTDFEVLKGQYTKLGNNLFLLMLEPTTAALMGVTRDKLQEQWEAAIKDSQKLPEAHQIHLIHYLSSGMKLTENKADDIWGKAAANSGADPRKLYPSDYLLYGASHFFYDDPLKDADDFHAFVTGRRRIDGPGLLAAERTIFDWSKKHPQ